MTFLSWKFPSALCKMNCTVVVFMKILSNFDKTQVIDEIIKIFALPLSQLSVLDFFHALLQEFIKSLQ